MIKFKASWVASALVVGLVVPAVCFGESLEDVEKQIKEAFAKVKTFSAKVEMTSDMNHGGMNMSMKMTGTYEMMHGPEGEYLYRMEHKGTTKIGEMEPMAQSSLVVCDGKFSYSLSESMGAKNAVKTKAMTDPLPWNQMREAQELAVLPSEKVEGEDCHVIESKPKTADASPVAKTLFYVRKDIGAPVKVVSHDKDGKVIQTTVYTEQKVNSEIPADRFKWEAPEGVTVVDMTGA